MGRNRILFCFISRVMFAFLIILIMKQKEDKKIRGFKAVIFDMDGVITQTAKTHKAAWKEMFNEFLKKQPEEYQLMNDKDYIDYIDGKPRYNGVESFLKSRNIKLPFGEPEDALISFEMQKVLRECVGKFTVAAVSGRDMDDMKDKVGVDSMIYAGSHGFRISGPDGLYKEHDKSEEILPKLNHIEKILQEDFSPFYEGVQIDRNRYAIGVHYRNAKEEDITDEDAYKTIKDFGIGMQVGPYGQTTAAKYKLKNVYQVRIFLQRLAEVMA
jgi:hypothetical protein